LSDRREIVFPATYGSGQPIPMGHEYCGIVEEVGNAVTWVEKVTGEQHHKQ
jgi:Zn-dependent alcohol dehydrogenase